jgi:hypothetical protein
MREVTVRRWAAAAVMMAAVAAGCGSGASSDSGPTVATVCAAYAKNVCSIAETCEPGVFQYLYSHGLSSCLSTSTLDCEASIGAPGSGATPALFEQCGSTLAAMTCAQYYSAVNDPSCLPHGGTIPDGGSCGDSWQCASGRCNVTGSGCGTCVAQAGLGAACTGIECADGLVCAASAGGSGLVCSQQVSLGQACFDSNVCPGNAGCGATSGTCDPLPGAGEACNTMYTFCDFSQGLSLCDPYLALCEAPGGLAEPDQACGYLTATSPYVACDGYCTVNPGSNAGTCFSVVEQGQPCTSADLCDYDLQCQGGVCVPVGPTTCDGTPADAGVAPAPARRTPARTRVTPGPPWRTLRD